jgi:ABC-type polysaccharide/polyol phosphate export permease
MTALRAVAGVRELVLHLASRELRSSHRRTALGWSWPLLIQLVQLAILAFVFQRVIPLGIHDYPAFVFSGLVFWSWLRGGLTRASTSITDNVPLVLEPRTPRAALPLVAIAVATFDLLIALPVLLVLVAAVDGVHATWAFLPLILALQALFMAGCGFLLAALHVYVRDVAQIVGVTFLILFYVTPVFYPLSAVPHESRWIFDLNPASVLIDLYRAVLMEGAAPGLGQIVPFGLAAAAVLGAGWLVFGRLQPGFADEL